MTARDRLRIAIARSAHEGYVAEGHHFFGDSEVSGLAEEVGASDADARRVLRELLDEYLVEDQGARFFKSLPGLVLEYQTEHDRSQFYLQNVVRREMLLAAADAERRGDQWLQFEQASAARPIDRPQTQLFAAARTLVWLGLIRLDVELPQYFCVSIEVQGLQLLEDEAEIARRLPTSPTEDAEAHEVVASDALSEVIWSCEEMLRRKGWDNALAELSRGDARYSEGDWTGAVREHYMAVESGLKYRLGADATPGSEGRALKKLAGAAAAAGFIPDNYQALFGYLDSIRSPFSHGAGPTPTSVEIGEAEALLMANHARALLLYLGHRP